jgi:BolA family transcriptional regulator, general stress-responsive regulator
MPTLQDKIYSQLKDSSLAPEYLTVVNESRYHNVPAGSESHFKAVIVSEQFNGHRLVDRHRCVYNILIDQLKTLHALALNCYTPEEWAQRNEKVMPSPPCRGGAQSEPTNDKNDNTP